MRASRDRSARRAHRSCLIVPATSERMLEKAIDLGPDQVVIDLEDAVSPAEKNDATRDRVIAAVLGEGWAARTVSVRVNAVDTEWFRDDVSQVVSRAGDRLGSLIVPKVESVETILEVDRLLRELEGELGLPRWQSRFRSRRHSA